MDFLHHVTMVVVASVDTKKFHLHLAAVVVAAAAVAEVKEMVPTEIVQEDLVVPVFRIVDRDEDRENFHGVSENNCH